MNLQESPNTFWTACSSFVLLFLALSPLFVQTMAEGSESSNINSGSPPFSSSPQCKVLPGRANDGHYALSGYYSEISHEFWRSGSGLENLKNMINDWNSPSCVFDDGYPRLLALDEGFSDAFRRQPDWSVSLARIEVLKSKFPSTAFVTIAEARYWIDYAWVARGGGFASSVTSDGWKLFRERLEKAEKVLINTKSYSDKLPNWYDNMIIVQSALDRPADERDIVFLEGARKYKTYYPIYSTMLYYLSPKWGGDWETVDNLVKWSVDNTKEIDGNSMYARLYWAVSANLQEGERLFKSTRASWPQMKNGFEDLMSRHPNSKWNLNNFAKFACMAGDKKTFLTIRRQVGNDVMDDAWSQKLSLDLCDTKFGYMQ
jgi:hypothetical protein